MLRAVSQTGLFEKELVTLNDKRYLGVCTD